MSKETFDFSEALKRMRQEKWVHREDDAYTIKKGQIICAEYINCKVNEGCLFCTCGMTDNDILATDWEEVEE